MVALKGKGDFGKSPHRYEIVAKDGRVFGWNITFETASAAAAYAKVLWPEQDQDEERNGDGWDIQLAEGSR